MKRVESLDYLRGFMALAVMAYHYLSWSLFEPSMGGEYVLGKLGVYAVSTFYILSGLSLAIVYQGKIDSIVNVVSFYIKRVFRIFPLFWFATTIAILYSIASQVIKGGGINLHFDSVILNYTLTFGFFDHDNYLTTGAWSIGNEMVFYALLPLILFFDNKSKIVLPLSFIVSVIIGSWFCLYLLNPNSDLSGEQWSIYINPFNQIFLFLGGAMIGKYAKPDLFHKNVSFSLLCLALLVFTFLPTHGDKIDIVTGVNRFILSFSCFIIVLTVFSLNPVANNSFGAFLKFLGESCYSIYLLHALVATPLVIVGAKLGFDKLYLYLVAVPLTLTCSAFTYNYIEKPSMKLGKSVVTRYRANKSIKQAANAATD
ncbi:acyltransferase family protein [Aeromonas caviae]|uniref:acyltransferase family protein n=1 Tax=Aeromonas caviae TaxID=648 RepID=UPI002B46679E|nr:acyltransferase [Aeromonas caviae]